MFSPLSANPAGECGRGSEQLSGPGAADKVSSAEYCE